MEDIHLQEVISAAGCVKHLKVNSWWKSTLLQFALSIPQAKRVIASLTVSSPNEVLSPNLFQSKSACSFPAQQPVTTAEDAPVQRSGSVWLHVLLPKDDVFSLPVPTLVEGYFELATALKFFLRVSVTRIRTCETFQIEPFWSLVRFFLRSFLLLRSPILLASAV